MSASLVGSEMCIRDRHRRGSPRLPRVSRRMLRSGSRAGRECQQCARPGAVSYTHLTLPTICSV
eukprot:10732548-Alexandrium_andersonii.AAC.1